MNSIMNYIRPQNTFEEVVQKQNPQAQGPMAPGVDQAKDLLVGAAAQQQINAAFENAKGAAGSVINFKPSDMDKTLDNASVNIVRAGVHGIDNVRSFRDQVTEGKISHFNSNNIGLFGMARKTGDTAGVKVLNAIIDGKNAAAKAADTFSRGASKGTYAVVRAALSPLHALGTNGEVVAETISTAAAAVVRGVTSVVTALVAYLPELAIAGAAGAAAFFSGVALSTISTAALVIGGVGALLIANDIASFGAIKNLLDVVKGQKEEIQQLNQKVEGNIQDRANGMEARQSLFTRGKNAIKAIPGAILNGGKAVVNGAIATPGYVAGKASSAKTAVANRASDFATAHPTLIKGAKGTAKAGAALGLLATLALAAKGAGYPGAIDAVQNGASKAVEFGTPYANQAVTTGTEVLSGLATKGQSLGLAGLSFMSNLYNNPRETISSIRMPSIFSNAAQSAAAHTEL